MPTWTAETGWRVGMRVLDGKGPKIDPVMVPVPSVTGTDLAGLYQACMKPDSASIFPVMKQDPLPTDLMNAYFSKAGEVGPYDYSKTPSACAGA
jgi:ribose transport system substrate-binding protein